MAGPAKRQQPSVFSSANDWIAERRRDLARSAHHLEAAGTQAWNEATRTGRNVQAATTAQLRALGAQVIAGEQSAKRALGQTAAVTKKAVAQAVQPLAKTYTEIAADPGGNLKAFGSGLVDAATSDLADPAVSLAGAAWDKVNGKSFAESYRTRMAANAAQDAFDKEHYGFARSLGQVAGAPVAKPYNEIPQHLDENGRAFGSGLVDAVTFDLADPAGSLAGAAWDKVNGKSFADSFRGRMAANAAQDAYDREHYGFARGAGQVLGTAVTLAGAAPLEGAALSARIAETTPLILREYAALTGAGAAAGIGGQVINDVGRGRPGSLGDYAGAAVGGAVGGALAPTGRATVSGAAMGATTSLAQDAFNGRLDSGSFDRAMSSARVGSAFGAVGGRFGRQDAEELPGQVKGLSVEQTSKELLGEDFSKLRTWVRGEKTVPMKSKTKQAVSGGYTQPDQRTMLNGVEKDLVESKFGKWARLTPRQREAYAELPNYRVDHTLPQDVGVLKGIPMSLLGLDLDRARRGW